MKNWQKKWEKAVLLVAEVEHIPVMLETALDLLALKEGGTYVDCTLGGGGHAGEILRRIGPRGRLIGFDKDGKALERIKDVLAPYLDRVTLVKRDFRHLALVLQKLEVVQVDGILFDLGVSAYQLLDPERGFSYNYDAPLDMRMDEGSQTTAKDLVNSLSERELADIIFRYGEEKWARRIARFIVERRESAPITTTQQLVEIIKDAIPAAARRKGPHPARRTFQALRIAVNDELAGIEEGVRAGIPFLSAGGRIVVITFHSLEDRIVKNIFREYAGASILQIITKKPLVPSPAECRQNPRARSAKLRAAEKLPSIM
ncbi:MAG: rRNA (cytosine1402-N4)-methyltransferase [Thermacetogenium sp.]|jgi:16S rRNA (cytosine1402-N4)-methyltransferase|nr:rRNA (cytosine1402-N4)-methyltransferase [Thermacetogenium sp.]